MIRSDRRSLLPLQIVAQFFGRLRKWMLGSPNFALYSDTLRRLALTAKRIATASEDGTAQVWTILPVYAGLPSPWFPGFLLYMAQQRLNSDGELEPIPPAEWLAIRARLRQVVRETAAQDTPYLRILRHFVHE